MTHRRDLVHLLSRGPRSASSLARELGLDRKDIAEELGHAIRTARASGCRVIVEPARCRTCGFAFDEQKLTKPGKCPACRGTRILAPQIRIDTSADG